MEEEKYNLLVIDDDAPIHIMMGKLLGEEYNILNAKSAQEGIDILASKPVHFILTDIHMPGMSGLDFLEALMMDAERRNIPVLIMTSLPTVDKEQKALGLGAADFIDKVLFTQNKQEVAERIRMKLVTNVQIPELPEELVLDKKEIIKKLMFDVSSGDFVTTTQKLCKFLGHRLKTDHLSFWTINGDNVQMLLANGVQPPRRYGPKELKKEDTFQRVLEQKRPYLVNNVINSQKGILSEVSKQERLTAEIGIPLFALTEKELIKNKMKIPPKTPLFGFVVLKRTRVFTSKEYKMTSLLMMNMGTILWRLYKNM
ncbi:MAG: response regulator [Balneola sp.]|nr:response regulator [Balneola sp.]|tara:strand:+ start:5861 stop:6799 length:939 start_codon:yes stop_codon:yes gene_type:complete